MSSRTTRRDYRLYLLRQLVLESSQGDEAADARLRRVARAALDDLPPERLLRVARCVMREYKNAE